MRYACIRSDHIMRSYNMILNKYYNIFFSTKEYTFILKINYKFNILIFIKCLHRLLRSAR